jgi:hypothetical protein
VRILYYISRYHSMNKTKTIVLLVTLTFELVLESTNFAGSAVA